ncbi:MAG: assimilatory sulfite reductase (NADPH) hemoprotein subunit [Oleiphilaceae bacterium]|nr:assimilatory sulfite reductase (NADPH) hemoprotein subunit [Oleiphilaceae bacterium]
MAETTLPKAEIIKRESHYLRGTLARGLEDEATGALADPDTALSKFHGIYQQDDRDHRDQRRRQKLEPLYQFMVRLRLPGGVLTPRQWLGLDEVAEQCANHTLRLTTRQTFQFHGVFKGRLKPLMQKVNALGIDSVGACGDVNRNVVTSVNPHESPLHQTVYQLASRISDRLRWRSSAYAEIWLDEECVHRLEEDEEPFYGASYLPRKFKIALAVPPDNDCDLFANDIGLIAIVEKGRLQGFNVAIGGGMGTRYGAPETYPRLATVAGFVPTEQAADACEAIAAVQRDYGARDNRDHARLKYTLDDLGLARFLELFREYHGQPMGQARPYRFTHNGDRFGWVKGDNGKSHLTLRIASGRVADFPDLKLRSALREIARVHKGEFRVTGNQNLIIAHVAQKDKDSIQALVERYGLDDGSQSSPLRRNALSCVAFPTCGLAMAESERYLPELVEKLEDLMAKAGVSEVPINLRVTGCPNGCARPYLAEIGLTGKAPGRYNLYLGGDRIGQRMNRLYRENIDEETLLAVLAPMLQRFADEREGEEPLGDFLLRSGIVDEDRSPGAFHQAQVSDPS